MNESIPEVFFEIMNLAEARGVRRINELPGCWELALDKQWWIALNGHREPVKCSRGADVPPFACYVEFNGWPAGLVSPGPEGGVLAAGQAANEDALIEALRNAARAS